MSKTTGKKGRSQAGGLPVAATTEAFVAQWDRLISTTNWEKGKIICQWRKQLEDSGAEASEYSDEAWSRRVGGVSAQHVGRLRRVYHRFGQVWPEYEGLFWSHFLGAVDWPDAEMWLEGAVQNGWTVAQMRNRRWETLGSPPELQPRQQDIVPADFDEDIVLDFSAAERGTVAGRTGTVRDPGSEESFEPDFGEQSAARELSPVDAASATATGPRVQPFAQLAELPHDLAAAFDSFKLAILRQKSEGWQDLSRDDLLATLDALKELALAP
ncbi:MAG: hypothetical protein GTO53_02580 [Planctomycetales bacterium]|nr:hypothetical protein [Planctomycetales bacterium]NIM08055.1 hypothetical protein [Planctomycetales bacterium]NIN07546.1 hypothetical protein [Planctomycetales bacterium]NIN76653.1 hypothetical protein [Planctomycetales bacterium]NIO33841.1 hypothetical protein [Planctomycetales bacterium]